MDTMLLEEKYNERLNRIRVAASLRKPDRVPVIANVETWPIAYCKTTHDQISGDNIAEYACFAKLGTDFDFDGTTAGFCSRDPRIYKPLGHSPFFYSADKVSVQHKECCFMEADEYDQLIQDPWSFMTETLLKRKFPALQENYPNNLSSLKNSLHAYINYIIRAGGSANYLKDTAGLPIVLDLVGTPPTDVIMDYFRGLKNFMVDIRRYPEKIAEAAEAITPLVIKNITRGATIIDSFPFVFIPTHIPTYLNSKQFEKLYWPSFSKMVNRLIEMGGKVMIILEGDWTRHYEYLLDFKKGSCIAVLDDEDPINSKKILGNHMAIMGGISPEMLKYSTTNECVERTKCIIDQCGNNGGFLLASTKAMLAPGDVNVDNLKAIINCAQEYGKY